MTPPHRGRLIRVKTIGYLLRRPSGGLFVDPRPGFARQLVDYTDLRDKEVLLPHGRRNRVYSGQELIYNLSQFAPPRCSGAGAEGEEPIVNSNS
jgi:hypothetical protein